VTDPLERLTNLVALLLETRRPLTLEEITDELRGQYPARDPARRTAFERDKRQLRDEGVPLEQTVLSGDRAGATGYWIDRSRYALPDLGLTDDETRALQLAVATVHLGEDWGGDALLKIGPPDLGATPADVAGRSGGPASPDAPPSIVAALASSPDLPQLFAANSERATVTFGYRGRPRRLDPYGLLARSGFWYVMGFDHDAGEVRTYRVDRIEGPVLPGPGGAFEIPVGFDPADTFPADAKMVGEGEVVSARVWISAAQAPTVVRELGEAAVAECRPDGDLVVTVPYANRWALRAWVMGLVDDAEILEPEDLRAEMVRWLEELAAGAGGPA
jgi:predicted DNA-binding transcriptional regulator YafY